MIYNKIKALTLICVSLVLSLVSCSTNDVLSLDLDNGSPTNKVRLHFSLNTETQKSHQLNTRTSSIDQDNPEINDLIVFVFKKDKSLIRVLHAIKDGDPDEDTYYVDIDRDNFEVSEVILALVANSRVKFDVIQENIAAYDTYDQLKTSSDFLFDPKVEYETIPLTATLKTVLTKNTDLNVSLFRPEARFKITAPTKSTQFDLAVSKVHLYGKSKQVNTFYDYRVVNMTMMSNPYISNEANFQELEVSTMSIDNNIGSHIGSVSSINMTIPEQNGKLMVIIEGKKDESNEPVFYKTEIGEILRNNSYTINFTQISGRGYNSIKEALEADSNGTSLTTIWNNKINEGINFKNNYFGVSKTNVLEGHEIIDGKFSQLDFVYIQTNLIWENLTFKLNNETEITNKFLINPQYEDRFTLPTTSTLYIVGIIDLAATQNPEEEFKSINLYVYNKRSGKLVKQYKFQDMAQLQQESFKLDGLVPGDYSFIAWGNITDNTSIKNPGHISTAQIGSTNFFEGSQVATNDALYYSKGEFNLHEYKSTSLKMKFESANIRFEISVSGITILPIIKVKNLATLSQ
ncbi:FimB/Mfa2 family fimbrial subunit, partial [Bacteroides propionicifaciens]